jgi:predicted phosphate transport protein (TIGR00153 family)
MLEKLFPRQGDEFFEDFDRHATTTLEAARTLRKELDHPEQAEALAARVKELEEEGDQLAHRAIERLHHSFLTPIDRGDVHRLISSLDDILDLVESSAERFWLYDVKEVRSEARELGDMLIEAVICVQKIVTLLRDLKNQEPILAACQEIGRIEHEADALLRRALARLFDEEKNAIRVMVWKELFEYVEDAIDRCRDVADVVEGVALEAA